MKFRVREEDTHFYLNKRKNGEYELMLHTGPHLSESVCFSKERLSQLKNMLKNRQTGNIHQKHKVFRHSITVQKQPSFVIELSRNIEFFGALIVDENYSVNMYENDLNQFVNWLGEGGF
ncbi:hypothetical protein [Pseudoalteromonas peptidolytica]|uniref:hypothetical protein n=1 Tax=Pseudoalteromonas peptidolytica TaxID=61150 RepID=UPI00298E0A71|nr:hypothetical protein [Pseudoalteromonas peptidolytica]MDW7548679.1 hypothetical protein [Pseudoalteromonas peptidolytica]